MTIDPQTNYIAAAPTVGENLWVASLPIVVEQAPGLAFSSTTVAVSPSTPYRVDFTFRVEGDHNYWFIVRELNEAENVETGFNINYGGVPSNGRNVYEFITNAATAKINIAIFRLDSATKTLTLDNVDIREIEEVTPYIRLFNNNGDSGDGPTNGSVTYVDLPILNPDLTITRLLVTMEGTVGHATGVFNCPQEIGTVPDATGYASKVGRTVVGGSSFNAGNNDHIFEVIMPPAAAPVVTGGGATDDLWGNLHGQECVRAPYADNFTVEYDALGDDNWQPLLDSNLTHFCKKVRIVANSELWDVNDVTSIESDHVFLFLSGGAILCDRTDRFVVEVTVNTYFYWMASFFTNIAMKGRRGIGSTVQGEIDYNNGSDQSDDGYAAAWAVVKRLSDNFCFAEVWDLAHERGQSGASGFRSLLEWNAGISKIYTFLEFTNPVIPINTEFTSRLCYFGYAPADADTFHAEMVRLGASVPSGNVILGGGFF